MTRLFHSHRAVLPSTSVMTMLMPLWNTSIPLIFRSIRVPGACLHMAASEMKTLYARLSDCPQQRISRAYLFMRFPSNIVDDIHKAQPTQTCVHVSSLMNDYAAGALLLRNTVFVATQLLDIQDKTDRAFSTATPDCHTALPRPAVQRMPTAGFIMYELPQCNMPCMHGLLSAGRSLAQAYEIQRIPEADGLSATCYAV